MSIFSTKAQTLTNLRSKIKSASILPLVVIKKSDWLCQPQENLERIGDELPSANYIVRSSCSAEDSKASSMAGAFLSILDVKKEDLKESISKVFSSYGSCSEQDEVLIQPMLNEVALSGVAFNKDPQTLSPYFVINWSNGTDTKFVTSGLGGHCWQVSSYENAVVPVELEGVVLLMKELNRLLEDAPYDCEFAYQNGTLYLLQLRPLILPVQAESTDKQQLRLRSVHQRLKQSMRPHPWLVGSTTLYGVMPDWNPAEIIGVRPRPLALSLYRELVTDSIWAYQRHNYGYRNLRSHPLIVSFYGMPYVDVRVSFNSFVPASINDALASKLVDHYLRQLETTPTLHDKVEFNIVMSSFSFNLHRRLDELLVNGFTPHEIQELKTSLRDLTNEITDAERGLWVADAEKIKVLIERQGSLVLSDMTDLEKIYWSLEDVKRYGTLPFAGLARAAFISVQMLRSLIDIDVFSMAEFDVFMSSVSSITTDIGRDRASMTKEVFLHKYGHLRPGTYDILSPRYDETPDAYFDWRREISPKKEKPEFHPRPEQLQKITEMCAENGINHSGETFLSFAKKVISLREESKFHFTRSLSLALSLMKKVGHDHGISVDDMSYADVSAFQSLFKETASVKEVLNKSIESGKMKYADTLHLALPPLIIKPDDVFSFGWPETSPNFITQKSVLADTSLDLDKGSLKGKIIFIPNADPGFDWIFECDIAGLVTAWGGVNSHMAIRALELGIPSVIGVGEEKFKYWSRAKKLSIDCASKLVEVFV